MKNYTKDQEEVLDLLANDISERIQIQELDLETEAESDRQFCLYEQGLLTSKDI